MKIWVTGSQDWDDSMLLARALTLVIQEIDMDNKSITFMHTDREGAEQTLGSYIAKTKAFLTGKGFKVAEFIPAKGLSFEEKLDKILGQSPDLLIIFNKSKDFKVGKIKESAKINGIKISEYR